MADIAIFSGVTIPNVNAIETSYIVVADEGRTAGGKYRADVVTDKRQWEIGCVLATTTATDSLTNQLRNTLWRSGEFWLNEFGSTQNAVQAFIRNYRVSRVLGTNRRNIQLTVIEQ